MFAFLKGTVASIGADHVVMDVQGVGYLAYCPGRVLAKLAEGEVTTIHTHLHVREDAMTLFGFTEQAEKDMFLIMTGINGVGPKAGLAILTVLTPREIAESVQLQSSQAFTKANGVGPKLAERIVRELKDKLGALPVSTGGPDTGIVLTPAAGVAADVMSALMNLGYREFDAQKAVIKAQEAQPTATFDGLFKAALQGLK